MTYSLPITPEAPPRFSTTTGVWSTGDRREASIRAIESPAPAGALGTMMRIVRAGYSCARSAPDASSVEIAVNAVRRPPANRDRTFMRGQRVMLRRHRRHLPRYPRLSRRRRQARTHAADAVACAPQEVRSASDSATRACVREKARLGWSGAFPPTRTSRSPGAPWSSARPAPPRSPSSPASPPSPPASSARPPASSFPPSCSCSTRMS